MTRNVSTRALSRRAEFSTRGSPLLTITGTVAEALTTGRAKSLLALMGSDIDAKKVVSSLTLFGHVAKKLHEVEGIEVSGPMAKAADEVLAMALSSGRTLLLHAPAHSRHERRGFALRLIAELEPHETRWRGSTS